MGNPGVAIVFTRNKSTWSEETFNKWYSEVHIKNVVRSGLSDLIVRYKNMDLSAEWPYLAVYRMPNLEDLRDPAKLARVPANDPLLPNGGPWREAIDMDMRSFAWLHTVECKALHQAAQTRTLITSLLELEHDQEPKEWHDKEHLDLLIRGLSGYSRSTWYKSTNSDGQNGNTLYLILSEYDDASQLSNLVHDRKSGKVLEKAKFIRGETWLEIASTSTTNSHP